MFNHASSTSSESGQAEGMPTPPDPLRKWIWILSAIALFLIGLIGAVLAGRYVRSLRTAGPEEASAWTDQEGQTASAGEQQYTKWISQLQKADDPVARYQAWEALVAKGSEAVQAALLKLVQISEDGNVFHMPPGAVETWVEMGTGGVESLRPALHSDNSAVRAGAAYLLAQLGGQAKSALPDLLDLVQDSHPRVRWYALDALAAMGPAASEAVNKIAPLLDHPDRLTRRRALLVLARIGPKAKGLLAKVQRLAKEDSDPSVREMAELAARQLNLEALVDQAAQQASEDLQPLIQRLRAGDAYEMASAARALAQLGPKAADALPALALALYHEDKWVREAAVQAMGAIGSAARSYRDSLVAATLDPEPEVRQAAQQALDHLEGRNSPRLP